MRNNELKRFLLDKIYYLLAIEYEMSIFWSLPIYKSKKFGIITKDLRNQSIENILSNEL